MNKYSYLITFSNLFERKYFDEHLDEFFVNYTVLLNYPTMNENIIHHSNKFIEVKSNYIFSPYTLLTRFPKVKIVKKVKQGKSTKYHQIKGWNCD